MLLQKDFIYVPLQGDKSEFNSRALNLLHSVGLPNRIADDLSSINIRRMIYEPIDWSSVTEKVEGLRVIGKDFLKSALSGSDE